MTSPSLWKSLSTPLVLVFQADTLLCKPPDLQSFEANHYTYIGGPSLHYGNKMTRVPWKDMQRPLRSFLNGGIALHRREWTLKCAESMTGQSLNEDTKWNRCRSKKVTALDALSFGSDNGFTGCFTYHGERRCPSAVHKPWVNALRKEYHEMERNCPRLEEMRNKWLGMSKRIRT